VNVVEGWKSGHRGGCTEAGLFPEASRFDVGDIQAPATGSIRRRTSIN
jgi:hypothetical protein